MNSRRGAVPLTDMASQSGFKETVVSYILVNLAFAIIRIAT